MSCCNCEDKGPVVYIVIQCTGEYSGYEKYLNCAFLRKKDAEAYAEEMNKTQHGTWDVEEVKFAPQTIVIGQQG